MATLDRSRPYSEHWGSVGLYGYQQDHREFGLDGQSIDPEGPPPAPARGKAGAAAKRTIDPEGPPPAPARDLAALSDDELRTMVEIAGGTWTGRAAATAFLAQEQ